MLDADLGQGNDGDIQGRAVADESVIVGSQNSGENDRVEEADPELNALPAQNVDRVLEDRHGAGTQEDMRFLG